MTIVLKNSAPTPPLTVWADSDGSGGVTLSGTFGQVHLDATEAQRLQRYLYRANMPPDQAEEE